MALYRRTVGPDNMASMDQEPKDMPPPSLPYATPHEDRENRFQALVLIVFLLALAAVFIVLVGGLSWPAAGIIACLSAVCIAFGHFLTRG